MGFWTRRDDPEPTRLDQLRAGLLLLPFRFGIGGLRRVFETVAGIEGQRDATVAGEDWWYLNNMAVHADLRGQGVGTELLHFEIERIAARAPNAFLALSTQREENVRFYERLGFEVASCEAVGRGPLAFRNWSMARRAQ